MKESLVLGIDAAWTVKNPSGTALLRGQGKDWRLVVACSSYHAFLNAESGIVIDHCGGEADCESLLKQCAKLGDGLPTEVIAVDMPLSREPIVDRREADDQVSHIYGGKGCSVHSPNRIRPGKVSDDMTKRFKQVGVPLVVSNPAVTPAIIEVYPHVALLKLMGLEKRHPYKVSKSKRYWPDESAESRFDLLLTNILKAWTALGQEIQLSPLQIPTNEKVLSHLKAYEDLLDAVVCAWMGVKYLSGEAKPLGDNKTAAIWVPI